MKRVVFAGLFLTIGCGDVEDPDHDDDHEHENELITEVELTWVAAGGESLTVSFSAPENDGDPIVDDIELTIGEVYDVSVRFVNGLEDPPEDLTEEIEDEGDQHQVFFTGDAVSGPATGPNGAALVEHTYADSDADGLPLGLANEFEATAEGEGTLTVTLRHLPPEGGEAVKTDALAQDVADDGWGAVGGENDAQVDFVVRVTSD